MTYKLNTIEEAIEDIKAGKVIIVVDDENRENEGDFLCAARSVTPEIINFMATHGRGLICAPLVEERCEELGLNLMVESNNAAYETPFTVSVDLIGHGCTTGISAQDRAKTIKALINPKTRPEELGKPGHIFPLKAKKSGVLRRAGHTEAAIDFSRLAGFEPAGVIVEIMNEDGTMDKVTFHNRVTTALKHVAVDIQPADAQQVFYDGIRAKRTTELDAEDWETIPVLLEAWRQRWSEDPAWAARVSEALRWSLEMSEGTWYGLTAWIEPQENKDTRGVRVRASPSSLANI